ncbi:MAG: PH domain-containing protein [Bacteroidales bacterium]|nr:PH domain-containing protein [Bacteroidales bacterium]
MVSKGRTAKYKSKIDWWIGAVLWVPALALVAIWVNAAISFSSQDLLILLLVSLPTIFSFWLVGSVFFNTYYVINGATLTVRCGVMMNTKIKIDEIASIMPTKTKLSSPALSTDRLEIRYGKYGKVVISPENKEAFIAQCKALNPAIETVECLSS